MNRTDLKGGESMEGRMRGVLVIGVGNLLRGDDGAGIQVVRRLAKEHVPGITLLEHPGDGADILASWDGWGAVIVVDAMKSGAKAGTIRRFSFPGDKLPVRCFQTGSTHAIGLGEAIELARHTGSLPKLLVVYGIEGEAFWLGSAMTEAVASRIGHLAEVVAAEAGTLMNAAMMAHHGGTNPSASQ